MYLVVLMGNSPPHTRQHSDTSSAPSFSIAGVLYSFDDWYQTYPALLMVTETTIINNNASLYRCVHADAGWECGLSG